MFVLPVSHLYINLLVTLECGQTEGNVLDLRNLGNIVHIAWTQIVAGQCCRTGRVHTLSEERVFFEVVPLRVHANFVAPQPTVHGHVAI